MRILVTIPHYFRATRVSAEKRSHGSLGNAEDRIDSLTDCLASLHQQFGRPQCYFDIVGRTTHPANQLTADVLDVIVCTTDEHHLLDRLPLGPKYRTHHNTSVEPLLLGFECHRLLRENLERYDYYCYLEDDLILRDPWFFLKLNWFNRDAGDDCVLQPNRYEVGVNAIVHKAYVDGELAPQVTAAYQDVSQVPRLAGVIMGQSIEFVRTSNPHSGCFFLNARQMQRWAESPWFLDRDTGFVGALESAATLGLMRSFRVYKPAASCAAFLEIEHAGSAFLQRLRS